MTAVYRWLALQCVCLLVAGSGAVFGYWLLFHQQWAGALVSFAFWALGLGANQEVKLRVRAAIETEEAEACDEE